MMVDLIDDYFTEYPATSGADAIAKTVAELTCRQDGLLRTPLILASGIALLPWCRRLAGCVKAQIRNKMQTRRRLHVGGAPCNGQTVSNAQALRNSVHRFVR